MEIQTKFNFGDKPWKIWTTPKKIWEPCGFCGETGIIFGKDEKDRCCPECYGRKGEWRHVNEGWNVIGQLTIGEIRVEIRDEDPRSFGDPMFDNYGPQNTSYKEEYMCRETGIGSGTLHNADTLFHTKAEAEAECENRNLEEEPETEAEQQEV